MVFCEVSRQRWSAECHSCLSEQGWLKTVLGEGFAALTRRTPSTYEAAIFDDIRELGRTFTRSCFAVLSTNPRLEETPRMSRHRLAVFYCTLHIEDLRLERETTKKPIRLESCSLYRRSRTQILSLVEIFLLLCACERNGRWYSSTRITQLTVVCACNYPVVVREELVTGFQRLFSAKGRCLPGN